VIDPFSGDHHAVTPDQSGAGRPAMIHRPPEANSFEFVWLAKHRAAQLMRGCTPRVSDPSTAVTTAQREVACGAVRAAPRTAEVGGSRR
jgi:hypothetical protein